jgi:hypothetical protein
MARIRSIKPEFFTSLTIGSLSLSARLTFIGLWTYCDDIGRGLDDVRLIRAAVWPLDDRSLEDVGKDLIELAEADLIERYTRENRAILCIKNWSEHQKVDHPKPSKFPALQSRSPRDASRASHARAEQGGEQGREQGYGTGNREQGGDAQARGTDPPESELAEVEVIEVEGTPGNGAGTGVIPLPLPRSPDEALFASLDADGRMSGAALLEGWIQLQPTRPSPADRSRFGRACKRIADNHTVREITLAFIGMPLLWPYNKPEPWTPEHLEKRFAEAVPAAMQHPKVKKARSDAAFEEEIRKRGLR